jgi:hypothetical protein
VGALAIRFGYIEMIKFIKTKIALSPAMHLHVYKYALFVIAFQRLKNQDIFTKVNIRLEDTTRDTFFPTWITTLSTDRARTIVPLGILQFLSLICNWPFFEHSDF